MNNSKDNKSKIKKRKYQTAGLYDLETKKAKESFFEKFAKNIQNTQANNSVKEGFSALGVSPSSVSGLLPSSETSNQVQDQFKSMTEAKDKKLGVSGGTNIPKKAPEKATGLENTTADVGFSGIEKPMQEQRQGEAEEARESTEQSRVTNKDVITEIDSLTLRFVSDKRKIYDLGYIDDNGPLEITKDNQDYEEIKNNLNTYDSKKEQVKTILNGLTDEGIADVSNIATIKDFANYSTYAMRSLEELEGKLVLGTKTSLTEEEKQLYSSDINFDEIADKVEEGGEGEEGEVKSADLDSEEGLGSLYDPVAEKALQEEVEKEGVGKVDFEDNASITYNKKGGKLPKHTVGGIYFYADGAKIPDEPVFVPDNNTTNDRTVSRSNSLLGGTELTAEERLAAGMSNDPTPSNRTGDEGTDGTAPPNSDTGLEATAEENAEGLTDFKFEGKGIGLKWPRSGIANMQRAYLGGRAKGPRGLDIDGVSQSLGRRSKKGGRGLDADGSPKDLGRKSKGDGAGGGKSPFIGHEEMQSMLTMFANTYKEVPQQMPLRTNLYVDPIKESPTRQAEINSREAATRSAMTPLGSTIGGSGMAAGRVGAQANALNASLDSERQEAQRYEQQRDKQIQQIRNNEQTAKQEANREIGIRNQARLATEKSKRDFRNSLIAEYQNYADAARQRGIDASNVRTQYIRAMLNSRAQELASVMMKDLAQELDKTMAYEKELTTTYIEIQKIKEDIKTAEGTTKARLSVKLGKKEKELEKKSKQFKTLQQNVVDKNKQIKTFYKAAKEVQDRVSLEQHDRNYIQAGHFGDAPFADIERSFLELDDRAISILKLKKTPRYNKNNMRKYAAMANKATTAQSRKKGGPIKLQGGSSSPFGSYYQQGQSKIITIPKTKRTSGGHSVTNTNMHYNPPYPYDPYSTSVGRNHFNKPKKERKSKLNPEEKREADLAKQAAKATAQAAKQAATHNFWYSRDRYRSFEKDLGNRLKRIDDILDGYMK